MLFFTGTWETLAYTITPQASYLPSMLLRLLETQKISSAQPHCCAQASWGEAGEHSANTECLELSLVTDPFRNKKKNKTQTLN